MEIILRDHIENLGRRGDVVSVANGYARNYLLPRKLALQVTEANKHQVERERTLAEVREAEERGAAEGVARQMEGLECTIERRVGETGTLYGSVTVADIAEAFEGGEFEISKKQIRMRDPIKELGAFKVPVKLHHDVMAEVVVNVVAEGSSRPVPAAADNAAADRAAADSAAADAPPGGDSPTETE